MSAIVNVEGRATANVDGTRKYQVWTAGDRSKQEDDGDDGYEWVDTDNECLPFTRGPFDQRDRIERVPVASASVQPKELWDGPGYHSGVSAGYSKNGLHKAQKTSPPPKVENGMDGHPNALQLVGYNRIPTPRLLDAQQIYMEERLAACQKDKQSISERLSQTIDRLESSERRNSDLEAQVRRLAEELKMTQNQLHQAEARQRQTAHLLDETALELSNANVWLTKTDSLSSTEVVDMVDVLNAEVMQFAAFMADTFCSMERRKAEENQTSADIRSINLRVLAGSLIRYLEVDCTQNMDPTVVQVSLQLCLVETCAVVANSWHPGFWVAEGVLRELYLSIQKKENQSVSGRWRAITRSQTNYYDRQSNVILYFARRVKDVLSLMGWSDQRHEVRDTLIRFTERLNHIVDLALRLHKVLGEDVTSSELKANIVYPGATFVPEMMDETFPDDSRIRGGRDMEALKVLGSTDLGLRRIVDNKKQLLRKPKVVLSSALVDILVTK